MGKVLNKLSGASAIAKGTDEAVATTGFKDFGVTGAFGSAGITSTGINAEGGPGSSLVPGFENFAAKLTNQASGAPTGAFTALDPNQAFQRAQAAGTGGPGVQQLANTGQNFLGGANDFLSSLKGFNADDFAAQQLGRLESLARPGEDRAAAQTANRLFSEGRLGGGDTRSGLAFSELEQGQQRAQTERVLASFGLARDELTSRLAGASGLAATGSGLLGAGRGVQSEDLQRFIASLSGGQNLGGFQQAFQTSSLNNAISSTAGISTALSPTQQSIVNLLGGSDLIQGSREAQGAIQASGAKAAGSAIGGLVTGIGAAFAGRPPIPVTP